MKEGWDYKKLSLVCSKITDGSHFSPKVDENGIYPMLSVKDMMAIGFNYTTCKYINENDYNVLVANGCKPKVNDVLVAKDGSYLKTAFVLKEDKEQVLLSSIAIITPRLDEIVPEYLAFYFKAPHTKSVVEKHYLTGTAIKRVILKGFKTITIPVPPLSEQQHIVEELDLLSSIIEKKKAQLNELDNLAQSLFYEMFGDPITNEKGWEKLKWSDALKIINGKNQKAVESVSGTYPIYGSGGIMGYATDFLCPKNTVIIGRKGNINKPILVHEPFWNVDTAFGLVSNEGIINHYYLYYFCVIFDFENLNKAVTIPSLTKKDLLEIEIPIPPFSLQRQFASKIEAIEHQKELIKKSIKEVETLFNSRMDYYFN